MVSLHSAVDLTKKYAAFFHGQLDDTDLHRWLISDQIISLSQLKKLFPQSVIKHISNYEIKKMELANKVSRFLSFIPTITSVAITGSMAVHNAKPGDDIDLMVITKKDTLWLTRLVTIPLISLFFKRRTPSFEQTNSKYSIKNSICLNLWLDEFSLTVPTNKRNLYTAHEVLQALPIYDRVGVYQRFITQNSWVKKYLANAYKLATSKLPSQYHRRGVTSTLVGEGSGFISSLNKLAYKFQYLYMKSKITNETISLHSAFFHPRNVGLELEKYLRAKF